MLPLEQERTSLKSQTASAHCQMQFTEVKSRLLSTKGRELSGQVVVKSPRLNPAFTIMVIHVADDCSLLCEVYLCMFPMLGP